MPLGSRGSSLEQEGRALVERLGGRWSANGGMCRCPAHDDRSPSLSVRPGRTRLLLHCFAGCDSATVLRAFRAERLIQPAASAAVEAGPHRSGNRLAAAALRIWDEARSIAGTPAERYLRQRGLGTDSPQLRFHPRTPFGPRPSTRYRPALLAAVRDETGLVAIQRTFIEPRGNALSIVARSKCGLGPLGAGAVRLGGPAQRLGLAEGIESALSATALFGIPCWAVLGTERFRKVAVPAETEELLLFLDNDAGGRRAEMLARKAFGHFRRIEAHYPPSAGEDWNDVLRHGAGAAEDAALGGTKRR